MRTAADLAYRAGWEKFIADFPATHAVTLVFNRATKHDAAEKRLKRFQAYVDDALLGRNWSKMSDRTRIIGVAENIKRNLHWHLAVAVPQSMSAQYEAACETAWSKLVPGGSVKVVPIYDAPGWASYICKQIRDGESHRTWFSDNVAQPSNG